MQFQYVLRARLSNLHYFNAGCKQSQTKGPRWTESTPRGQELLDVRTQIIRLFKNIL